MNAVEIAIASAKDRVAALDGEVARLLAKSFPTPSARTLLQAIAARVKEIKERLTDFVAEAASWEADLLCMTIQGLSAPVVFLHQLLHYLDKVDSPRLPFEIVDAFQELTTELGIPSQILLKPDRQYNYYTLLLEDIGHAGPGMAQLLARAPDLVIVGFPSAEADSTLLHTTLFHEIGHVLFRRRISSHVSKLIEAAIKDGGSPERAEVLIRWTEEVCCDLVALRLVGPPYWFAFEWYSVALQEQASASESHPDVTLRADAMSMYHQRLCTKFPEAAKVADAFGVTGAWHPLPRGGASARVPAVAQLANTKLRDAKYRESLFDLIDQHVTSPFQLIGLAEEIAKAANDVSTFIPPGSMLSLAQFRTLTASQLLAIIFGAVWHFRIKNFAAWDKFKVQDKAKVLSELTIAAVEGSALVRKYARR